MNHAWLLVFEFIYVHQTTSPKAKDPPVVWQTQLVFLTKNQDLFELKEEVREYIREHTSGSTLGSQRTDLKKIEYIGKVIGKKQ